MYKQYSPKRRKQLEHYFRSLSSIGITGMLGDYYMLYDFRKHERYVRNFVMKSNLKSANIYDGESLKERVSWLLEDGYREEYKALHNQLFFLSDEAKKQAVEASKDEENYGKLMIVYKTMRELPSAEIGALGGGMAILLCRMGEAYGYVTKEESWELMLKAAAHLQRLYDSWAEYCIAFAAGSHFAKNDYEFKHFGDIRNRTRHLMESARNTKKAAWHQDLTPDRGAAENTPTSLPV